LTFMGVFLFSWVASLYADFLIVRKVLKLGTEKIEYRESHLPAWNPVGPIALVVASVIGSILAYGLAGPILAAVSAFVAGFISFVLHVILAVATKGKYYTKSEETSETITTMRSSN